MAGYQRAITHSINIWSLIFLPAPPTFPYFGQTFLLQNLLTAILYIYTFLAPIKAPSLVDPSCLLPRVHGQTKTRKGAVRDRARSLGDAKVDGNGAAPAGVRGRHGRHALLLPLVLPGRAAAPAPAERGGAEAEPAGGDGGAGGVQGGAAAEGADHRKARRPRAPGGQGARRGAGPGPAPPAPRQAAGAGAGAHPAAAGRAGHVQRHRLGLQPRLVPRRPLLRPRHLLRPPALRQRRQAQPAPAGQAAAAAAAVRRRRRARHARGEEAAAAEGPVPAVRHGGRAAAAEPARRRPAPAVAQPAPGARARRAPRRRRPWRRRSLPQRGAPPRRRGAGLRPQQRQRLHEAADARHGHGRRQLLAGLRRQAAQAALTLLRRVSVAADLAADRWPTCRRDGSACR